MDLLKKLKKRLDHDSSPSSSSAAAPPEWAPAAETSHAHGLYRDATEEEYEAGERFCEQNPVWPPRLLPSDIVERIETEGCKAWSLEVPTHPGFLGRVSDVGTDKKGAAVVHVATDEKCKDTSILSTLPILAGLYDIGGKDGVYFEITVHRMDGVIAIGTACRPYPSFRLPGWNRLSAGLHLDDLRKFFEDPDGGMDFAFPYPVQAGDTVGCGYDFRATSIFFTHNGQRLPSAFAGVYLPRVQFDIYAAIGVSGANALDVNFGGELFRWKEGNEWAWRLEGHVGRLSGPAGAGGGADDELPTYAEARVSS